MNRLQPTGFAGQVREVFRQNDPRIRPQQDGVTQRPFLQPSRGPLRLLQIALDAEKVPIRAKRGGILQKQSPPRSDLQLEGTRRIKKPIKIERGRRQVAQCLKPPPQITPPARGPFSCRERLLAVGVPSFAPVLLVRHPSFALPE